MDLGIKGRSVLISGGAGGIGKAICSALAKEGAKIAICDVREDSLKRAVKEIETLSKSEIIAIRSDITNIKDVQNLIAEVVGAFGRIDILINSVGNPPSGAFLELSDETWKDAMELKFFGYVRMCREVLPHMIDQKWGRIINMIGASWKKAGRGNYCGGSVNAALMILTANLATEMGKWNILVNGICPGPVMTEMWTNRAQRIVKEKGITMEQYMGEICKEIPLNRLATAEDIAAMAVFLASERTSYITGTCFFIDGGGIKCI